MSDDGAAQQAVGADEGRNGKRCGPRSSIALLGRHCSGEAIHRNRRELITLAGAVAIERPVVGPSWAHVAQDAQWRPDGVGAVARLGVLTPHFDPVPESEMWAMAPEGVSIHTARVYWQRGDARTFAEPPHVDNATESLTALAPRAIAYAFTASSYALGAQADEAMRARLESRAQGIPVILTCPAASEALRTLGARRIALVHPPWFTEEATAQGLAYFTAQGVEVVFCARIMPPRAFGEVPPAEMFEWTRANVPPQAEAIFIAGNGLRAVGTIQRLEERLGRPVLTANQVLFWKALRLVGAASKVTEYGRLFTHSG